ncbi:MAG: T9SS type A sorting domain-containing protein [Dysgonamonadaceae bacterium]|jgi:hypothetical protein|nr:T9SS type A sorting domain-containing protein [Dysgonamonadaceae bacterium]
MTKKIFFLAFCLSLSLFIMGQTVCYTGSISNFLQVKIMDMEKTTDDELIIAVNFQGHRHMGDYYGLYKYHNTGEIEWKFQFFANDNTLTDYLFLNLTLDDENNIYGLVYINGGSSVQEYQIEDKTVYSGLNLMKINPQGEVLWNKKIGENVINENACIDYKNGNLYIMGTYIDSLNLDNQFTFISQKYYQCYMWMYQSGTDYFIAKYDTNGVLKNATSFGEDYPDDIISMEIDDSENIYFTGVSDNFPCVSSYTHITKLDSCLNFQWISTLSHDVDSPVYIPMNIHYSKNGKIYLWNIEIDNISNGVFVTANKSPCLMEIDKENGQILRKLSIETSLGTTDFVSIIRYFINGFIDDFGNDLIVHTAVSNKLIIGNDTTSLKEFNHTFVLLRINLADFSATFIKKFEGETNGRHFWNVPGKIITDEQYIYFSGEFGENPLAIYDATITNMSANYLIYGTDVFFCKIDMSSYLNGLGIQNYQSHTNRVLVFPNPVSEILYIQTESEILNLKIFSIDGKNVFSSAKTNKVDVSKLKKGLYFINIRTDKGTEAVKIIVK